MSANEKVYGKSYIPFPCDFPIKVMGYASNNFAQHVANIVNDHLPDKETAKLSSRYSRNGRYISVTVTVYAKSKAQLDAIYQDLTADDQVLWVL